MARMRTVKPGLRTSRVVGSWPFEIRYFWVLLWGYLDDKGRGLDSPKAIAGDCYPLPADEKITASTIDRWLATIARTRLSPDREPPLCRYEVDGARYLHALNWGEHQRPNRPKESVLPPCPTHDKRSAIVTAPFTESVTDSGTPNGVPGTGGLEYWRVGGGDALTALAASTDPPPPETCPKHPDGTDDPCRACGQARKRHEQWQAERRARIAAAARCQHHPDQLAANCGACRSERIGAA